MIPIVGSLLGAVVGGLLAMAVQVMMRVLREWGDVRMRVHDWEVIYPEGVREGTRHLHVAVVGYGSYNKNPDMYDSVTASYSLSVELFNEKDLDTALQDVGVIFYKGGDDGEEIAAEGDLRAEGEPQRGLPIGDRLHRNPPRTEADLSRPRRAEELLDAPSTTLELPSRRSTRFVLSGVLEGEAGLEVMRSNRAALKATFPDGEPFDKKIGVLTRSSSIYGEEWQLSAEELRQRRSRWQRFFR